MLLVVIDLRSSISMAHEAMSTAVYPSIDDLHIALKAAADEYLDAIKHEPAGGIGWAAALITTAGNHQINVHNSTADEEVLQNKVRELTRLMGHLHPNCNNDKDLTVARQLHHLYSIYFTGRPQLWRDCNPEAIINVLAHKAIRIESDSLWPDGSWLSTLHKPNSTWLSEQEYSNVVGEIEFAVEHKKTLRRLGYAPLNAPTKEALDDIWHDVYIINSTEHNKLDASSCSTTGMHISPLDKYAVVSYVQCADGRKPPASWTAEVDSVLAALVQLDVITGKALWFDKLASRQYKDSQKWWGAAATMQFLFNPVIVILPRMSEHSLFSRSVGPSIWGSSDAVDGMYIHFLEHARNCKECQSCFALRWALQQDHVIPVATLRTWPRVEHALGASGLGLFTSETTYSALVACLTCAYAMFGAILKNDPAIYRALEADAAPLPSTYLRDDGSILIGGWVMVSCSEWGFNKVVSMASLKDMSSCLMELHNLFCQMHNPKLVAIGRKSQNGISNVLVYEMIRLSEAPGLFYLEGVKDVDVPTLARFNTNDKYTLSSSHEDLPEDVFVTLHHHWALAEIQNNQPQEEILTTSFVAARQRALATLVYTNAAKSPCYAWSDKLVAAILLSLPNIFAEAVTFWNKGSDWLTQLGSLLLSQVGIKDEEIEWDPNTLIVALALLQRNYDLHRLVPRPPCLQLSTDRPVKIQPFNGDDLQSKCFAAFFLGHVPLRSLDALRFHSASGTNLPLVQEWVHKMLQDGALCNINVVVIRSLIMQTPEHEDSTRYCWHCQRHKRRRHGGVELGSDARPPAGLVIDIPTLQEFVQGIVEEAGTDDQYENVMWGLGSFDPISLAALCNEDHFFGEQPDTVAVLFERRTSSEDSAGYSFHAHALAHFCVLGSKQTYKCNACHAIIILEKHLGNAIALWTILPMLRYKERYELIPGFEGIIG